MKEFTVNRHGEKKFFSIFKLSIKFISCALKLRLWQNI